MVVGEAKHPAAVREVTVGNAHWPADQVQVLVPSSKATRYTPFLVPPASLSTLTMLRYAGQLARVSESALSPHNDLS
jgi:hypothetical protein